MKDLISIKRTNGYKNLSSIISSAIEDIGGLELSDNDRVLIKPNLCNFRAPSSGAIIHPLFLDAFLCYLNREFTNLDVTVIESDATSSIPEVTLKWFGFDKILERWNAKWYNLSHNPTIKKTINGFYFKEIEISEIFNYCDYFITLPKLKTHSVTKITASLKNQFGCIPYKNKVEFHKNIHDVIADANLTMKPDLCLVDGIVSMGGGVAIYGVPIKSDILIAGKNPVSVDTVCAKLFGYNPEKIAHINKSKKLGVGSDKYMLAGDIEDIREIKIDREFPFYKEVVYDLGRYLQNQHSLIEYFKKMRS